MTEINFFAASLQQSIIYCYENGTCYDSRSLRCPGIYPQSNEENDSADPELHIMTTVEPTMRFLFHSGIIKRSPKRVGFHDSHGEGCAERGDNMCSLWNACSSEMTLPMMLSVTNFSMEKLWLHVESEGLKSNRI